MNVFDNIVLSCASDGHTRWYYQSLSTQPISTFDSYAINSIELQYNGLYFCYGLNINNQFKHFISAIDIEVYGKTLLLNNVKSSNVL